MDSNSVHDNFINVKKKIKNKIIPFIDGIDGIDENKMVNKMLSEKDEINIVKNRLFAINIANALFTNMLPRELITIVLSFITGFDGCIRVQLYKAYCIEHDKIKKNTQNMFKMNKKNNCDLCWYERYKSYCYRISVIPDNKYNVYEYYQHDRYNGCSQNYYYYCEKRGRLVEMGY